MRRSPSKLAPLAIAVASCGPPLRLHPDAEHGCTTVTLAGQEDVAAAAGCTALDSLTIKTAMTLDLSPLRRLTAVHGTLLIGPTAANNEIIFNNLKSVGTLRIASNLNLQRAFFPSLEHAGAIQVEGNPTLFAFAAPFLIDAQSIAITDNSELQMIDFTKLGKVGTLAVTKNPKLDVIEGELPELAALPRAAPPPTDRVDGPSPGE